VKIRLGSETTFEHAASKRSSHGGGLLIQWIALPDGGVVGMKLTPFHIANRKMREALSAYSMINRLKKEARHCRDMARKSQQRRWPAWQRDVDEYAKRMLCSLEAIKPQEQRYREKLQEVRDLLNTLKLSSETIIEGDAEDTEAMPQIEDRKQA
jgi:hypothetical protein